MSGCRKSRIVFTLATLAVLVAAAAGLPARAGGVTGRPAVPDSATLAAIAGSLGELPGYGSSALRDDATALFANPAGIDRSIPLGYYFSWDTGIRGRGDLGTLGLTAGPLGIGYQQVRPAHTQRFSRWVFALGGGTKGPVSVGVRGAREHQDRLGPDEAAWRWDAGLMWRPHPTFSFGATARDLSQDRMFGQLYHRSYTVGVGLRPLPIDRFSRLTLFADLAGGEKQVWKDEARLSVGAVVEPLDGVELAGSIDGRLGAFSDDRVVRLAIGMHGRRSSSWGGTRYDRRNGSDERVGELYAMHGTVARQRTMQSEPVLARIRLAGAYGDESQGGLPIPIPMVGSPSYASIRPVLRDLARAETDPDVRGLLLELGPLGAGALTSELRDAIHRVRAAGKPVVAVAEELEGPGTYHVAAACDRIVIDPVGGVARLGMRADVLYLGEMLDSAGVQVEKVAHGKYKTAGENLILSRASDGMKESVNSVIDDMRDQVLADVSADRRIPRAKLEEMADGRMLDATEAIAAGLVDTTGDIRDAEKLLAKLAKRKGSPKPVSIAGRVDRDYAWAGEKKVAVLWLDGGINSGPSGGGFFSANTMGSATVVRQLRALEKRRDVAAVVLRIDSPGGSGLASDHIWRAVEELQKKGKKVVVSMSRVAGSGGYYIACGADEIFADPMTITGSIGVLSLKPNLAGFYRKHRIGVETYERGGKMGMYSSAVALTEAERTHMLDYIDRFYGHFLDRVAAGRPLTREQVDAVGQGRIWTGRQALDRKLIDRIGGLHEATARARELAGLTAEAEVVDITRPRGGLLGLLADGATMAVRGFGSLAGLTGPVPSPPPSSPSLGSLLETPSPVSTAGMPLLDGAVAGTADPLEAWAWKQAWIQRLSPGTVSGPLLLNPVMDALLEAQE